MKGSGNVYKDLGVSNPEEALAKAELAHEVYTIIKSRRLTQKQAAEIMGIDQPRVSDIIRGKLSRYSLDRLMRCLRALGRDVEIRLSRSTRKSTPSKLSVVGTRSHRRQQRPHC